MAGSRLLLGIPLLVPASVALSTVAMASFNSSTPPSKCAFPSSELRSAIPPSRIPSSSGESLGTSLMALGENKRPNVPHAVQVVEAPLESSKPSSLDNGEPFPNMVTEFMVDMKCEGCATAVRNKLEPLDGVKKVDIDLTNQVVRVLGSTTLKNLNATLEQTGRKYRLIGQGSADDFLISAAVAEFKGPVIHGVVRFAQINMELARIEASFSGLAEGCHGWSINEYGDLTRGAASTGQIFNPIPCNSKQQHSVVLGDLGIIVADKNGEAEYAGVKPMMKVSDLIGRALVLYGSEDKSVPGIAAAVIARSAGVGENYKKICTCDGTVIWESSNSDFVKL